MFSCEFRDGYYFQLFLLMLLRRERRGGGGGRKREREREKEKGIKRLKDRLVVEIRITCVGCYPTDRQGVVVMVGVKRLKPCVWKGPEGGRRRGQKEGEEREKEKKEEEEEGKEEEEGGWNTCTSFSWKKKERERRGRGGGEEEGRSGWEGEKRDKEPQESVF